MKWALPRSMSLKSLCNSIPVNGTLVTAENKHKNIIEKVTLNNDSKFISSNEYSLPEHYINNFSYIEHPQNIAIALDVCEQLGVKRDIAIKGMHDVQPDLGALCLET